jgi:transglutaminase-like putative cysteine protease/Tfp pilus assembly protein PilF
VSLNARVFVVAGAYFFLITFLSAASSGSVDVWDGPAFSASPEALRQAAAMIKAEKDSDVTVLLSERRFDFDAQGKEVETHHSIYRIENEEGVKGWAETTGHWEPWRQARPEIKARVIGADGAVHVLDPKTLNDVPVHRNDPEVYSDRRAYGGPLPAVAVGAIVEEEIIIRDTVPFFAAGKVERQVLARTAPVSKSRIVLSHANTLPLRYLLRLLPNATVSKAADKDVETITIENGPIEAYRDIPAHVPSDVVLYPQIEFSTGTTWQQIASEYARLANDKMRLEDVQAVVANLNTRGGSRTDVIRRIVTALHKNVRYTGIEFGESGLIPQFPSETLKRKYGDCKDKATLLAAMLRAAGIPANLALVDSGPGQEINAELPGMGLFDHAIVYVPASGTDSELWVDATAKYSRVGDLPTMDYGRWALIVDEHTSALKKIPELRATENFHRETREFTMAEYGPAKIVEKNEQTGPRDAEYRAYYDGDVKRIRENSEKYVKREYLADSLISIEHGDLSDLEQPVFIKFVTQGKRGTTDDENATMAIRVEDLFEGLPDYFTSEEDEKKDSEHSERPKPRVVDWEIRPFVNEWDYKIVAPPGFKLRALPPAKEEPLGTAKFSQTYTSDSSGSVVEAVLRFDTGKSRLTVQEAEALRKAVRAVRNSDPIFISFDQIGHTLMAEGKVRAGLAAYHQLVSEHPKQALYQIQLARAFLAAGLAEKARAAAKEAVTLEPNSAQAQSTLAWILQHDLMGRRLKKGFDYAGAVAAYRKAKQLDPKDKDIRANLAILLEYDPEGERYAAGAHLKDAIAEFQELKKMDEASGRTYDDNVLYDLWYLRDFKTLGEALTTLPASEIRRGLLVGGIAAEQGTEPALKKSLEITSEEASRRKILANAGWLLLRLHKYSEAADLLSAGARGQDNETQTAAFAGTLKRVKTREEIKIDDSSPSGAMQRLFSLMFTKAPDYDQMVTLLSKKSLRTADAKKDREEFRRQMFQLRTQMEKSGLPLEVLGDIALANTTFSVEGTDSLGYRVTLQPFGAPEQEAFVVREGGGYKVLEFVQDQKPPENLSWQALELVRKNDLAGARKWLDWAREKIHMGGSDDPLSAQPFPYFWTKGQQGDASAVQTAALVLAPSKELKGEDLRALLQARDQAKTEQERTELDLVAAWAYSKQDRWPELMPVAERLLKAYPDSLTAFRFVANSYGQLKRFDEWEKLVNEQLSKHPDEYDYLRSAALLARYRGDYAKARQLTKTLIDRSKATQSDLNQYAWDALFLPAPIEQDSIAAAERANQLSKNSNFSIMHTLVCIYAHVGKETQAHELLLKAMDAGELEEPDSSVWLALGQIAEEYGENDAAQTMYARVEKPDVDGPGSNYGLAQQRLAGLKTPAAAAKSAGH